MVKYQEQGDQGDLHCPELKTVARNRQEIVFSFVLLSQFVHDIIMYYSTVIIWFINSHSVFDILVLSLIHD